jgi:hypothetical protein
MFKFFKEIMAEAKQELAEEKAAKEQADQEIQAQNDALSDKEKFAIALGAPYRRLFITDEPAYYVSYAIPDDKKKEAAKYLERDFGVQDRDSLLTMLVQTESAVLLSLCAQGIEEESDADTLVAFLDELQPFVQHAAARHYTDWTERRQKMEDFLASLPLITINEDARGLMALWMARFSYANIGSVGLGYIHAEEAQKLIEPLIRIGTQHIKSWEDYGALFKIGDKVDGSNTGLGRKVLASGVDGLVSKEDSIWKAIAWPSA